MVEVRVPFYGHVRQYHNLQEEIDRAIHDVLESGVYTLGPEGKAFEGELADYMGMKRAIGLNSGTDALWFCLLALGVGKGDEVITTSNTFFATAEAVWLIGATPVFVDIDPKTRNMDVSLIEEKITPRTKAIIPVHLYGQPAEMPAVGEIAKKHNLFVLEDCAHTPNAEYKGRKAGSIGDIGCFSFHSLKNMTTCGEGGMITTNRDEFVDPIEKLRCMNLEPWENQTDYWIPSHFNVVDVNGKWGCNYRMNEIQAAVGRAQLRKLDMLTERRRERGHKITAGLQGIRGVTPVYEDPNCNHVYHLYTVCVEEDEIGASRDDFMRVLYREEGVQGILHYQPTYHFDAFKKLGYGDHLCPVHEKFFYHREFNICMNPRMTDQEIQDAVTGIRNTAEKVRR